MIQAFVTSCIDVIHLLYPAFFCLHQDSCAAPDTLCGQYRLEAIPSDWALSGHLNILREEGTGMITGVFRAKQHKKAGFNHSLHPVIETLFQLL